MAIGSNGGRLMSEINVTPFVDVMLVLLIIFMVTAPMMTQGVDVNLPKGTSEPLHSADEKLIVVVDEKNNVYINKEPVKLGLLKDTLKLKLESLKKKKVYLKADRDILYGTVVSVMSEIKEAGVDELGMVTVPDDGLENKVNDGKRK